jgi:alkylation response protein AidB-like acyl-CoA dehydrogenase
VWAAAPAPAPCAGGGGCASGTGGSELADTAQRTAAAWAAEIEEFVEGPGERWSEEIERSGRVPAALWQALRERGYLRLAAPQAYGGVGLSLSAYLPLLELFSRCHGSIRMIVHVCNGIWRPMARAATPAQVERFVKPLVAGTSVVAFTLTEPHAGTGADIQLAARRDGDTYYLTGEKHLITFGTIADYLLTIARLEGTTGAAGTLALMVPRPAPGLEVRLQGEGMGLRGTDHAHLRFHDTPVPVANRLGAEGDGLTVALRGFLDPSRIGVACSCVGLAQKALDLAVARSKARVTFGRPLAERQAIQMMLAEMATDVQAARQLVRWAGEVFDAGPEDDPRVAQAAAMSKLFGLEMLQRVTDRALQVFGGWGYLRESPIERIYRDARAQRFEEGTAEIQKTTIARTLLA